MFKSFKEKHTQDHSEKYEIREYNYVLSMLNQTIILNTTELQQCPFRRKWKSE